MDIPGRNSIEFLEDVLQILFFDAYAVVLYRDEKVIFEVTDLDNDMGFRGIFKSILEEVDHGQFKMGLIGEYFADPVELIHLQLDPGILLFDQRLYLAEGLFDEQLGVEVFLADGKVPGLDGGSPQEPLDLLLQVLRLVADDGGIAFQALRLLGDGPLREYIGGDLHNSQRRFELVGEVVDKVFLRLGEEFLAVEIEQAGRQSDKCEKEYYRAHDPEIHLLQYVFLPVRKVEQDMVIVLAKNGPILRGRFYPGVAGGGGGNVFLVDELLFRRTISRQVAVRQYAEIGEFFLPIETQRILWRDGIRLEPDIVVGGGVDQVLEDDPCLVVHFQVFEDATDTLGHVDVKLSLLEGIDLLQPIKLDGTHNGGEEGGR